MNFVASQFIMLLKAYANAPLTRRDKCACVAGIHDHRQLIKAAVHGVDCDGRSGARDGDLVQLVHAVDQR